MNGAGLNTMVVSVLLSRMGGGGTLVALIGPSKALELSRCSLLSSTCVFKIKSWASCMKCTMLTMKNITKHSRSFPYKRKGSSVIGQYYCYAIFIICLHIDKEETTLICIKSMKLETLLVTGL